MMYMRLIFPGDKWITSAYIRAIERERSGVDAPVDGNSHWGQLAVWAFVLRGGGRAEEANLHTIDSY